MAKNNSEYRINKLLAKANYYEVYKEAYRNVQTDLRDAKRKLNEGLDMFDQSYKGDKADKEKEKIEDYIGQIENLYDELEEIIERIKDKIDRAYDKIADLR